MSASSTRPKSDGSSMLSQEHGNAEGVQHQRQSIEHDTANEMKQTIKPEFTVRSVLATGGAALAYLSTVGLLNAFGVFQEYYQNNILRGHSPFQISWLGSFALFTFFAGAPPAGILSDKFGPTVPMACGSVALVFAIFMISLCQEYYQFFLAQGVLLGFAMSFVAVPASGMVPKYFARHRALATGVSIAGSSLGGILWPIVFDQLFHHDSVSFGWSLRIAAFIQIPLLILVVLFVRPPVREPKKVEEGLSGGAEKSAEAEANKKASAKNETKAVFKTPPFFLTCLGLFIAYLGFFSPFFFISTYAVSLGMSPTFAFYLVSIVNGLSLIGRILPGLLADRYGKFNLLIASLSLAGICAFCWTKATSIAGVVVWGAAYGFSSGAILSLQLACMTSLATPEAATTLIGATMGSVSLAGLFGTPINGAILEHGGYLAVSCFAGATLLVGGVLVTAGRLSLNKKLMAIV